MANDEISVGQTWAPRDKRAPGRVMVTRLNADDSDVGYVYADGPWAGSHFLRSLKSFRNIFTLEQDRVKRTTSVFPPHLLGTATTEPVRPVPETFTRFGKERAAAMAGNPKDAIGSSKAPTMTVPTTIQAEDGLAMLEGALKYGRHNYRAAPVRASVYLDAARRHMNRWIEGEEIDPDSGLSHLAKARACFGIIRDAQICGTLIDDRPPPAPVAFFAECDKKAAELVAKYPNPVAPYVANDPRMPAHDPDFDAGPDHE